MNQSQYFEFEDKKYDFPYYKNKEIFSKKTGLIMLLSVILFIILLFGPVKFQSPQEELILFLAMMIPFIIATGGKLGSLFKRPRLSDLKLCPEPHQRRYMDTAFDSNHTKHHKHGHTIWYNPYYTKLWRIQFNYGTCLYCITISNHIRRVIQSDNIFNNVIPDVQIHKRP